MRIVNSLLIALLMTLGSFAVAQDDTKKSESCDNCPSSTCTESCQECPVTAAMKNLPAMTYKVGEKSICCGESAAALAKENNKPMHFVVGEKTFEDKTEAYTALVVATEKFVEDFITPSKCEKSGKTSIAGKSCNCPVEAGQKTELVKKAISEVKMTYVVGEEKCQCPTKAKELASKSEDKTTYVVAGKETCCNLEARMNLAKAKYAAAVKALASTEKKAETAKISTDS